jgi:tetratricopeptide (TPR) repeat protein
LGGYAASLDWNWAEWEREKSRALELAPQSGPVSALIQLSLAGELLNHGDVTNAFKELDTAQGLDPRSEMIAMRRADFLVDCKKFKEALAQLDVIGAQDSGLDLGARIGALCGLNRYAEAVAVMRQAHWAQTPKWQADLDELAKAVSTNGASAWWRAALKYAQNNTNRYEAACAYAQLGETNAAITNLQADLKDKMWRLPFSVRTDWRLDPVRSDDRFKKIVRDIGFK